jgi:hypothetical protein
VKERRGALGRATELAESVVAGVKRRQAARLPKVLLYDEDGRPRTLDPASEAATGLVETARAMVELAGPDEPAPDAPEEEEE